MDIDTMQMQEHEENWLKEDGAGMVGSLGVAEGNSVIDFGCGKGRYSIPLSQAVGETGSVLSIERQAEEIAELRERMAVYGGPAAVCIANQEALQFDSVENSAVDHVFAFDVLQFVPDWTALFASMRRVLKPGGLVHIYPAAIPHPGSVDMERVAATMRDVGLEDAGKRRFHMMHNKHMVDDDVHTFRLDGGGDD